MSLLVSVLDKVFPHPVKTGFAGLGEWGIDSQRSQDGCPAPLVKAWPLRRVACEIVIWLHGACIFEWSQFKISDAPISATT
jgi:hypothetical protein